MPSKRYGLNIIVSKTKLMIVSRQPYDNAILCINNQPIEKISKFKYLDSTFNDKWDSNEEVKIRTAIAKTAFARFHKYFLRQEEPLRLCVIKYYIWPILLYGTETWSLKVKSLNRIKAFEIWTRRRLANLLNKTHEEVLLHVNTYILWRPRYILLKIILTGKIERKRAPTHRYTYSSTTLETDATSQMLPLYADVQKKARFRLCDKTHIRLYYMKRVVL